MSSRTGDFTALSLIKLTHRRSTSEPIMQETHDRLQKNLRYHQKHLKVRRTEEKCMEIDELAQKNFTNRPSPEEFERYEKTWFISLKTSGRNARMKLRSNFSEAVTKMLRFHRDSGDKRPERIPFYQYRIRLFLPVPHGGSGMTIGGAHKFIKAKSF